MINKNENINYNNMRKNNKYCNLKIEICEKFELVFKQYYLYLGLRKNKKI